MLEVFCGIEPGWDMSKHMEIAHRSHPRVKDVTRPANCCRSGSRTKYLYDGLRPIQERDGSNNPTVSYTRGSDLSGTLQGAGGIGGLLAHSHSCSTNTGAWSTHNYYHADGTGNITFMLGSSQGMVASYRYDPFGNTISSSGSLADANVYRFSSKECHVRSGMLYYLCRLYDPASQRWLSCDPIGERGGINLYAFVFNKPTRSVDAWGLRERACPPNHKPCGTRSSVEERRQPDGTCVKTCNYTMDQTDPVARKRFTTKNGGGVFLGDGESMPIIGAATPYIIRFPAPRPRGAPPGPFKSAWGFGFDIPCDQECPSQVYCGIGPGPAGGPQIVW
jgi:RHS repeat-associated protein